MDPFHICSSRHPAKPEATGSPEKESKEWDGGEEAGGGGTETREARVAALVLDVVEEGKRP